MIFHSNNSLLMIVIPLLVFGALYYLVFNKDQTKVGYCGIGAVLSVNAVIGSYIFMAWQEKRS